MCDRASSGQHFFAILCMKPLAESPSLGANPTGRDVSGKKRCEESKVPVWRLCSKSGSSCPRAKSVTPFLLPQSPPAQALCGESSVPSFSHRMRGTYLPLLQSGQETSSSPLPFPRLELGPVTDLLCISQGPQGRMSPALSRTSHLPHYRLQIYSENNQRVLYQDM